ncbi:TPA: 3-deoxy-7-phosphoheptulonate synthase [Legionella pneumophila]|nr:3-deoxy-7-phosphoheptulonate synthase [Legionella pneumophila]HAT8183622.1 3-deoxy-7-phosphoheptulonate synthase [Legionella pneumophila]
MKEKNYSNLRITDCRSLISLATLMQQLPLMKNDAHFIQEIRQQIKNIIHNKDDRLIAITGPCSIHDINSAWNYAELLKKAIDRYEQELLIIMRVYFEKPRTSVGWKGFINDPYLDNSYTINDGLRMARELLLQMTGIKVPAGTEFLDPFVHKYISDFISWGAIGARTSESQIHRALASSLPMAIGFKNNTDGNIQVAVNAVYSARQSHHIFDINEKGEAIIIETSGNEDSHVVLRGSHYSTNYDEACILQTFDATSKNGLSPKVIVDCSHGNCQKNYANQRIVVDNICQQIENNSQEIAGIMLESNLLEGNQSLKNAHELVYGKSITDACISWEETEFLLEKLATAIKIKRNRNAVHHFLTQKIEVQP